ncbi:MAG: sulfotransferase [Pseudomonadales bacterium]
MNTNEHPKPRLLTPKVFCIGFHKTGTSSLAAALSALGYRVAGHIGVLDPDIAKNVYPMTKYFAERYDAFQDNPWPIIFKDLDKEYPDSKFVMSIRDSNSWIESQVKHFGSEVTPMREWIYGVGCPLGNESVYIRRLEQHNNEVMEYFAHRPKDLLVMDFSKGDGWKELCTFLGHENPNIPFPHHNKASDRENAAHNQ